jgi:hypothetical protein
VLQVGRAGFVQSEFITHCTHVLLVVLQMVAPKPAPPAQLAFPRHSTQRMVVVLQ